MATDTTRRMSRPCYNKPHRCPGWAGGGTRGAKIDRCDGGSIRTHKRDRTFPCEYVYPSTAWWRFGHCTRCGVITWPFAIRWFDWRYLLNWKALEIIRNIRWAVRDWRLHRSNKQYTGQSAER